MTRAIALLIVGLLGACAAQRIDTSSLPAGLYASGDQDDAAMYDAVTFFRAVPANGVIQAPVARVARVLAVIEYLGGEVNTDEHFSNVPGALQVQAMQARDEVRAALGVAANARSQEIVDALLAASRASSPAAQKAALASPVFTLGPDATLARLSALPPLPISRRVIGSLWNHEFSKYDAR